MADGDKKDVPVGEDMTAAELESIDKANYLKEVTELGRRTVDEVIDLAEKAEQVKEHDVLEEESAQAEKIRQELDKELVENDGWVKILGNEELMKKVIKSGDSQSRPLRGDVCKIRIIGQLADDSTVIFEEHDSLEFQLGDAEVISGLDLSIPLMTKGEVAHIKIAYRFAYGSKGLTGSVPPNSSLSYEVELLDFDTEKDLSDLSVTERRSIGNRKKERGNWWYARDEASLAVQCYRRALEFLDEVEGGIQYQEAAAPLSSNSISPELKALFDDRLKTLNNMAAAQLKLQAFEPALNSVDAVLKCQPNNVKALFRKGKILGEKGETEKALNILQKARSLDPEEKSILVEMNRLGKRRKKEEQSEKLLYKRMFKDSSSGSEEKDGTGNGGRSMKSTLSFGLVLGGVAFAVAGMMAYRYRLL